MNLSSVAKSVLWNLMLAGIPVVLAYAVVRVSQYRAKRGLRYTIVVPLLLVWLVFLPNTCYLLTEWRHFFAVVDTYDLFLRSRADSVLFLQLCMLWIFYFLYSAAGMLTFALAIRPIKHLAARRGATLWVWVIPFFVALSLGVYLGLILRFNSWDLLSHPSMVWRAVVEIGGRPYLAAFIAAFGVFLWISYEAIDLWVEALAQRLGRITGRKIRLSGFSE